MVLNALQVRESSFGRIQELGFPRPPAHFPVLWEPDDAYSLRDQRLLRERAAVLNVVVARTFGMPKELGIRWLDDNDLRGSVTAEEEQVLLREDASSSHLTACVEALWCLTWILGLGDHLDPRRLCSDTLVHSLPDLKAGQTFADWTGSIRPSPRTADEVAQELDLYYCLTWGLAESHLTQQDSPGAVEQYVIWQRRHALEWALQIGNGLADPWDHVDLST